MCFIIVEGSGLWAARRGVTSFTVFVYVCKERTWSWKSGSKVRHVFRKTVFLSNPYCDEGIASTCHPLSFGVTH